MINYYDVLQHYKFAFGIYEQNILSTGIGMMKSYLGNTLNIIFQNNAKDQMVFYLFFDYDTEHNKLTPYEFSWFDKSGNGSMQKNDIIALKSEYDNTNLSYV